MAVPSQYLELVLHTVTAIFFFFFPFLGEKLPCHVRISGKVYKKRSSTAVLVPAGITHEE